MTYFVYGLNSSGIAAACTAADLGIDVIAMEPRDVFGYMWTGGLLQTDNEGAFSQTPKDHQRWGLMNTWANKWGAAAGIDGGYLKTTQESVVKTFEDELNKYNVRKIGADGKQKGKITWRLNAPITAVTKNSAGDVVLTATCGGTTYSFTNWTDATDELDMCKLVGIPLRLGRESKDLTGAPTAGNRPQTPTGVLAYDPVTGQRLKGVRHAPRQKQNEADTCTMSFNERILVTNHADRILFGSLNVPNWNPRDYDTELDIAVNRNIRTIPGSISNTPMRPVGTYPQYDMNNGGGLYIGSNWVGELFDWHNSTEAERKILKQNYEIRTAGLFKAISSDAQWASRRPEMVTDTNKWGLIPGMFPNSYIPGMSAAIYVREGPRIVGQDDILFEDNFGTKNVDEPMTSYGYPHLDAHLVRRFANANGKISFEGNMNLDDDGELFPNILKWGCCKPFYGDCKNGTVIRGVSGHRLGWVPTRIEISWIKIGQSVGIANAVAEKAGKYSGDLDHKTQIRPALVSAGSFIRVPGT